MGARRAASRCILGYFGLKAMRSRKQNDFDDSLSRLAGCLGGGGSAEPRYVGRHEAAARRARECVRRGRVRYARASALLWRRDAGADGSRNVTADDGVAGDTAINLDQGDPLAEADFHMAYGLYDQAADLVRIAISREPDRRDLKLKLLEVFFVWGNTRSVPEYRPRARRVA